MVLARRRRPSAIICRIFSHYRHNVFRLLFPRPVWTELSTHSLLLYANKPLTENNNSAWGGNCVRSRPVDHLENQWIFWATAGRHTSTFISDTRNRNNSDKEIVPRWGIGLNFFPASRIYIVNEVDFHLSQYFVEKMHKKFIGHFYLLLCEMNTLEMYIFIKYCVWHFTTRGNVWSIRYDCAFPKCLSPSNWSLRLWWVTTHFLGHSQSPQFTFHRF